MKKMTLVLLALSISMPVLAQDVTFLPKAEVETLAAGKKWIFIRSVDKQKISWDIRSGGNIFGNNLTVYGTDGGTWLVNEQGQLCTKWRGRSPDRCVALLKDGEKLKMIDSNDLKGTYGEIIAE